MGKPRKWTVEMLAPAIANSFTWADVCRKLNLRPMTGSQTHLKNRAVLLGLEFSHFQGKHYKGAQRCRVPKPLSFYLSEHSTIKSDTLKKRLIAAGLKDRKCERCDGINWLEQLIPLELHHINGIHDDCRFENLQILCPNCHALENTGVVEQPDTALLESAA